MNKKQLLIGLSITGLVVSNILTYRAAKKNSDENVIKKWGPSVIAGGVTVASILGLSKIENKKDHHEPQTREPNLFYDVLSDSYFESTSEDMVNAEYEFNRLLFTNGHVDSDTFWDLIGVHRSDDFPYYEWYANNQWVSFEYTISFVDDDLGCNILTLSISPVMIREKNM